MGIKIIAKNKKASYNYTLIEKFEAGISLKGTEVKSLREGKVTIAEAWVDVDKNQEIWINNMTIPQYEFGNINNHQEQRKRKLLLNKKEILRIDHQARSKSLTLIPTMIYFKKSLIKIEIALGKGKKLHDKRADSAKRDVERKLQRKDFS